MPDQWHGNWLQNISIYTLSAANCRQINSHKRITHMLPYVTVHCLQHIIYRLW